MPTPSDRRALIYCRLSPTPRMSKEENLAQQESLCRALCEARGWAVVDVIVEIDASASKGPRDGWERAVSMARRGEIDAIVSRHPDRMYRQPRELEDLVDLAESLNKERGVILTTVDGDFDLATVGGRLQARVAGAVARGEVERKAERQKLGHQRRAETGKPFWTARPFGFERTCEHREPEASAIRQAYMDVLNGDSLYSIARRLNEKGLMSPKGNPWRSANLRHVLMHPRNAAVHTYLGEETGSAPTWEPIVSEDVYRAVVRLLEAPERRNHGGGRRKGLLTGVVRCSKCNGKVIQSHSRPNKAGERYRLYICREHRCISIPADWLESYVLREVIDHADEWAPDELSAVEPDEQALAALRDEETDLQGKARQLTALVEAGVLDEDARDTGLANIERQLADVRDAIANVGLARGGVDTADLELLWQQMDGIEDERLRSVIERATEDIALNPRGKGARLPKRADVSIEFRRRQTR